MIFSSTFSRLVVKIWIYSLHLILCFSSLSFSSFLFWPHFFHLSSFELWLLHIEPIALPCCCSLCSWWYIYILNLFIYYHFVSNWFLLYSMNFLCHCLFFLSFSFYCYLRLHACYILNNQYSLDVWAYSHINLIFS